MRKKGRDENGAPGAGCAACAASCIFEQLSWILGVKTGGDERKGRRDVEGSIQVPNEDLGTIDT